jgi:hypothetical protein
LINLHIDTADIFHPTYRHGTFDRGTLRKILLKLTALSNMSYACSQDCPNIPNQLKYLGIKDVFLSPSHLRNYYERLEGAIAPLSDSIINRLGSKGHMMHIQDGYIREQYATLFKISNKFDHNQFNGIRGVVLDAIDNYELSEGKKSPFSVNIDRTEKRRQYKALLMPIVLQEALSNVLHQFAYASDRPGDNPNSDSIRKEAKDILRKGELI